MERAIDSYGMPLQVLTDHGTQFYANWKGIGVSTFDLWCYEKGIHHILAGVRKPTTIGKVERWHRTLQEEFLRYVDPTMLRERLREFIDWYNNRRIHFGFVEVKREDASIKRKRITFIPAERFFAGEAI
jgi:transposase InsO family protein